MSKPIKITKKIKESALKEFAIALDNIKMSNGKISYNKTFSYKEDDKAKILFTPTAYAKMISLIMKYDSEIAWHGIGKRLDGAKFLISDIVVYPQTVSGGNVEMDTEEYAKWIIKNIDDERFDHIIMQGHSHVDFSTKPSSVDLNHQESILSQLTDDMYYIFLIWNKKLEHTTSIYDLQNNVLYEDKDISYGIYDEDFDIDEFFKEANDVVKRRNQPVYKAKENKESRKSYNGNLYGSWNDWYKSHDDDYEYDDIYNDKFNKQTKEW